MKESKKNKNNKKSVCIIGNLSEGEDSINGQSIKTVNLIKAFEIKGYHVDIANTFDYKKHLFKAFFTLINGMRKNKTTIMLPDFNGFRVFSFLLPLFRTKNKKIYYSVVGGWLPNYVLKHRKYVKRLARFDGIWVENEDMKQKMESSGLNNVHIVENFKIYNGCDFVIEPFESFQAAKNKLCFLSRVDEDKGITEAMLSVIDLNRTKNTNIYFDIYGPIFDGYATKFQNIINQSDGFISYKGLIQPDRVPSVIKEYLVQLFPTRCNTEGIPGSIVDSFAAGVPVIATQWNPNFKIISDMETGLIVKMNSISSLEEKILFAIKNKKKIYDMKKNCIMEYRKYDWEKVFSKIEGLISNEKSI